MNWALPTYMLWVPKNSEVAADAEAGTAAASAAAATVTVRNRVSLTGCVITPAGPCTTLREYSGSALICFSVKRIGRNLRCENSRVWSA